MHRKPKKNAPPSSETLFVDVLSPRNPGLQRRRKRWAWKARPGPGIDMISAAGLVGEMEPIEHYASDRAINFEPDFFPVSFELSKRQT